MCTHRRAIVKTWPILSGALFLATHHGETDSVIGGACDFDPERASARARAEAVERATLIERGPELLLRREELLDRGMRMVTPDPSLTTEQWWLPGQRLGAEKPDAPAAVPALTSLLRWTDGRALRWKQSSVGTAAHPDPDTATESAVLETVERHAVRRVWQGTATVVRLDAEPALPPPVRTQLHSAGLGVHAWRIHEDLPASVVLCAVARRDKEQITFGACARRGDLVGPAIRHAVCEAVSVRAALANTSADPQEVAHPRVMAARQNDFLDHLAAMEAGEESRPGDSGDTDDSGNPADLGDAFEGRFGVRPVIVDLRPGADPAVIRAVVPHHEFLVPGDSEARYVLSPGYIE
jgi:ribosomal protein S12 methylthiotransferase accessory factor YcaO